MPNKETSLQIERGELIQTVDDSRDPADPFKLTAAMRSLVDTRLADLSAKDLVTSTSEAGRATASANIRTAFEQLNNLLHDGYNFIKAIPSFEISDADRLGLFTLYGWTSGKIGELNDSRLESLSNLAIAVTPTITNPDHQYPPALIGLITAELATVNANQPLATGGTRQAAVQARDAALELMEKANDRVRFFYCSASDDEDQTPELASIGRQPRRDPGDAQGQPLPEAPVGTSFDDVGLTLSLAEMPVHATSIRAYRQPTGGAVEVAGESETTMVSLEENGPLTPDVTYEFWLVGVNSTGEGPESERFTHLVTAPV